jgi:hypothetical protein
MPAFIFITVVLGSASLAQAEALDAIKSGLPEKVLAWTKSEEGTICDDRTIFDYIDGAAEVYRAYNMRRSLSRIRPEQIEHVQVGWDKDVLM